MGAWQQALVADAGARLRTQKSAVVVVAAPAVGAQHAARGLHSSWTPVQVGAADACQLLLSLAGRPCGQKAAQLQTQALQRQLAALLVRTLFAASQVEARTRQQQHPMSLKQHLHVEQQPPIVRSRSRTKASHACRVATRLELVRVRRLPTQHPRAPQETPGRCGNCACHRRRLHRPCPRRPRTQA